MANILVVCTANVCRSPLAELVLRRLCAGTDVTIESAGTHAIAGHTMDPGAAILARESGVDEDDIVMHRARLLTETLARHSDLVLTMTLEQRSHVAHLIPDRTQEIHTLREFAWLTHVTPISAPSVYTIPTLSFSPPLRARSSGFPWSEAGHTPPFNGSRGDTRTIRSSPQQPDSTPSTGALTEAPLAH